MRSLISSRHGTLHALAEAIQERLNRHAGGDPAGGARLAGQFGSIRLGPGIHEWFMDDPSARSGHESRRDWRPGLVAALEVAQPMLAAADVALGHWVWIGRRCWPHPPALARISPVLLRRSLFVEAQGEQRVWAVDLALRSGGVAMVVADASKLSMADSRRLQLAAEAGGTLGMLLRPPWEVNELSAARTRWRLAPAPSDDADQRWTVELLRCKGVRPTEEARRWAVQRSHATGNVSVVPHASHRTLPQATTSPRRAV